MPMVFNFVYIFEAISVDRAQTISNKPKQERKKNQIITSFSRFYNLPINLYNVINDVTTTEINLRYHISQNNNVEG